MAGASQEAGHRGKRRLGLDELVGWGLVPPLVVADAGYAQNADFRHAPAKGTFPGWSVSAAM
ncbi:hypothetical protein M271_12275 [Streptomyces rapamycinicus NRRL 5491]|nr:hypothetical protein M271_12275 [Streptomyces rapamycinicus NRRL 5491]